MRARVLTLFCAGLAACALVFPVAFRADAQDAAEAYFEAGSAKLAPKAADALWKAADAARKGALFRFARETAERVVVFAPDHRKARELLGFKRKKREWVVDPKRSADAARGNERARNMTAEALREREAAWRDGPLRKAELAVAQLYAGLGKASAAKGHDAAARRAFEEALGYDTDCAAARAGLGYQRVGEIWLTAKRLAARERAATPAAFEEESALDALFGRRLAKVKSANFRGESTFAAPRLLELIRMLEVTYTYYLTDMGRDPNDTVWDRKLEACFVGGEPDWSKWIDQFALRDPDFYRKLEYYRDAGTPRLCVRETSDTASDDPAAAVEDNAIHCVAHVLNHQVFGVSRQAWLDEGLTYYYTLKVRGSTQSWCVQPAASRYGDGAPSGGSHVWETEHGWRQRVRQMVASGDDMPLRMLMGRKLSELEFAASVKGWSVVTWLMDTDRKGFLAVLGKLRGKKDGAPAFEAHYGKGVEALDDEWRDWVRRTH